jgi:hypothetical protein
MIMAHSVHPFPFKLMQNKFMSQRRDWLSVIVIPTLIRRIAERIVHNMVYLKSLKATFKPHVNVFSDEEMNRAEADATRGARRFRIQKEFEKETNDPGTESDGWVNRG